MHKARRRRLYFILCLIAGSAAAVYMALLALRQSIDLYVTPQQVYQQHLSTQHQFRLGGLVVKGSVHYQPHSLTTQFQLTDYHAKILVIYTGVLPSLFREGQGIVAEGRLNKQGEFIATQVLAKHDASYRPPNIAAMRQPQGHDHR